MSPAFAEDREAAPTFLDQLEALAKFQVNDLLEKSVRAYYDADIALEQGDHPTLLHDAAIMGLLNLLDYLVKHDAHGVDYAYKKGPTPLGYIAGDNQLDAAKILLEAGANPNNEGNMEGKFPLSSAIISGNVQMVRLLLDYKAQIHSGHYYQSPLGLILERNDLEILQIVDRYDFQLDALDDELRKLVLEYLNSDFIEEDVLKILIKHGFDIYAKSPDTAAFIQKYSKQIKHADVKQMLQDLYIDQVTKTRTEETSLPEQVKEPSTAATSSTIATTAAAIEHHSSNNLETAETEIKPLNNTVKPIENIEVISPLSDENSMNKDKIEQ